ncbi:MAG: DUF4830 domain-containing protein [Clostridia bacterium]|nr:DUF4830 domain-containing protein [Clostridia bacterium]MBO5205952.1 DUF4830 domain-containing protein [Clostridia bacterium]MBQ8583656.1 DUF4830 domain-containing protein [Clostridia bacterium]
MFVCSVRASTVKLFGFMALTLLLIGLAVFLGGGESVMAAADATLVDYSGMKTNEDRVAFIKSFGLEIEEVPEECAFTMPEDFDRVIAGYNELQKKQGLDLSKYAKKRVTRYTYKVTNYDAEGEVYASLFIYRSKVVACDIASASPEGFVVPLTLVDREKLK